MNKRMAWVMALLLTLSPTVGGLAHAEGTTSTSTTTTSNTTTTNTTTDPTTSTTTGTTDTTTSNTTTTDSSTSGTTTDGTVTTPSGDGTQMSEEDDDQDANKEDDSDDDDSKDGHGKKKGHEYKEKKQYKFESKLKGIANALESLLKARNDGKGEASNSALDAVIEKLKEMLKQDGTATSDDEAEQAVEETVQSNIDNKSASDDEVELLVTMQVYGKKVDQAQTNVETALENNPKSDKLYNLLSKVYKEKGDTKKPKIYVNGKKPVFDVEPYNKEGRNMVPVRAIAEALGAKVGWNQDTQTVIIIKDGVKIELPLGSNEIKVNGVAKKIDSAAEITSNRTMVPVRFISEFLGQQVNWDAATNMVIVK